uniref:DUF4781 domain-containing protein n=1 Tax=Panagrolaimus sp. PS1159 TaxID=55785 RepID=A0AC35GP72_9BILA
MCYLLYGDPQQDLESDSRYELQLDKEYEELIRDVENEPLGILAMYKSHQRKKAEELTKKILSLERKTPEYLHAAIIFVCVRLFDSEVEDRFLPVPVIRVLKESGGSEDLCWFVDLEGRSYKSWKNYLSYNNLPQGEICFPCNGIYLTREIKKGEKESDALLLNYGKTAACRLMVRKILSKTNTAVTVASFGALATAVAGTAIAGIAIAAAVGIAGTALGVAAGIAVCPVMGVVGIVVAPVVAAAGIAATGAIAAAGGGIGAAAIFCGNRAVATLIHRGIPKETLAPKDAESRGAWIAGVEHTAGNVDETQEALTHMASSTNHVGKSTVGSAHATQVFTSTEYTFTSTTHISKSVESTTNFVNSGASTNHVIKSVESTTNFVNSGATAVGSDGVINQVYSIFKGYHDNEIFSTFDLMQISLSSLILTHSLVTFETAKLMMHEAKGYSASDFENNLNDHKPRDIKINCQKTTVRTVRLIDSTRQFFHSAYQLTSDKRECGRIGFDETGNLFINGTKFSAAILSELNKSKQDEILADLKLMNLGILKESVVVSKIENWMNDNLERKLELEKIIQEIQKNIFSKLHLRILKPHIPALLKILEGNDSKDFRQILLIAFDIFESMAFTSPTSLFQIIVILIYGINDNGPKSSPSQFFRMLGSELREHILDFYLKQVTGLEANYKWIYLDYAQAKLDFKNYGQTMQKCGKETLGIRDYWKTLQEFFDKTRPLKDKSIDKVTEQITFENNYFKGAVWCIQVSEILTVKSVQYFQRKESTFIEKKIEKKLDGILLKSIGTDTNTIKQTFFKKRN